MSEQLTGDLVNVLEEALKVTNQRRASYGSPLPNMQDTADIWSAILRPILANDAKVSPAQVAMCMIGLKLAREAHKHSFDNVVDMAGYASVLDHCTRD